MAKSNIQETETKVKSKSKKTKKVDDIKVDDVKIDDVKVDVEVDLRSSNSMQPGVYIRRKRSI